MAEDMSGIAKSIMEKFGGGKGSFENVLKLFSSPSGKKVLETLLADGGKSLKAAAEKVKSGDKSGIEDVIASISATDEGKALLEEITGKSSKGGE